MIHQLFKRKTIKNSCQMISLKISSDIEEYVLMFSKSLKTFKACQQGVSEHLDLSLQRQRIISL